jgi:transcriptional regulator with XRE-family HTH domain
MVTRIGPKKPFRHFLRAWRKAKGLTQETLAERLGTSKGQISNWETYKKDMTANVVAALAEALGIEPSDIFRDPDMPSIDTLLGTATPEQRRLAVEMVKTILKSAS